MRRRAQGASTITQQVAKNFLLTNERSFDRKIKEALLALRMEQAYSKDKILELYVNEIYLGQGAYGVAAASLLYFNKSIYELTVPEAAYLAALPKGPNNYHPINQRARAVERRNYVIDRMVEDRYLTTEEGAAAKQAALTVKTRPPGAQLQAAAYFAEEVRRAISERYGETKLYEGGLSVRTTLDPQRQHHLLELAREGELVGEKEILRHLLGDGGGALGSAIAAEILYIDEGGAGDAAEIDAAVLVEILVLGGDESVGDAFGDRLDRQIEPTLMGIFGDERAVGRMHAGHDRRLVDLQLRRVRKVLGDVP